MPKKTKSTGGDSKLGADARGNLLDAVRTSGFAQAVRVGAPVGRRRGAARSQDFLYGEERDGLPKMIDTE